MRKYISCINFENPLYILARNDTPKEALNNVWNISSREGHLYPTAVNISIRKGWLLKVSLIYPSHGLLAHKLQKSFANILNHVFFLKRYNQYNPIHNSFDDRNL